MSSEIKGSPGNLASQEPMCGRGIWFLLPSDGMGVPQD